MITKLKHSLVQKRKQKRKEVWRDIADCFQIFYSKSKSLSSRVHESNNKVTKLRWLEISPAHVAHICCKLLHWAKSNIDFCTLTIKRSGMLHLILAGQKRNSIRFWKHFIHYAVYSFEYFDSKMNSLQENHRSDRKKTPTCLPLDLGLISYQLFIQRKEVFSKILLNCSIASPWGISETVSGKSLFSLWRSLNGWPILELTASSSHI